MRSPAIMPETDHQLLIQALAGDQECFVELYRRRQGPVYRFALHMTGSPAIAEDVTQEVFLALIEGRARFDPERGTLGSFLFGVARNRVLRRLAKDRAADGPAQEQETVAADDLLEEFTRRETVERVRAAVLSLPEAYREAVALCDLEDASYEEAAAALECPVGTVRSRLNRGRAMLARKLGAKDAAGRIRTGPARSALCRRGVRYE